MTRAVDRPPPKKRTPVQGQLETGAGDTEESREHTCDSVQVQRGSARVRQMARRLGFLPDHDELAAECLEETRQAWTVPCELSDSEADEYLFDVAMGLFAWCRYLDLGHPLPRGTEEWYAANTHRYLGGSQ
jgi:hypothetical protein